MANLENTDNLEIKKQFVSAICNTTINNGDFSCYEKDIKNGLKDWLASFSIGRCGSDFFENENYCNYLRTNGVESEAIRLVQQCVSLIEKIIPYIKNRHYSSINYDEITRVTVENFSNDISKSY